MTRGSRISASGRKSFGEATVALLIRAVVAVMMAMEAGGRARRRLAIRVSRWFALPANSQERTERER